MKPVIQVIWPLSIVLLLAALALRTGGTGASNPLSDHSLENWFSVTRR